MNNISPNITIKVHDKNHVIARYKASSMPGDAPTIITAQKGMNYELINDATHFAPENITIKRVGNDLLIAFEDPISTSFDPDLIIRDYYQYTEGANADNGGLLIGMHENGSLYPYVPGNGSLESTAQLLDQEMIVGQELGNGIVSSAHQFNGLYWLGGLLGIGGLIAAAASGGGSGGGAHQEDNNTSSSNNGDTTAPVDTDNDGGDTDTPVDTDNGGDTTAPSVTVNDSTGNDTTPEITGTVDDKNATVHVVIKDGEGNTVQEGDATVDNGNWSYTPDTDLPDGDYTVEVTAKDEAGNTSTETGAVTVDTTAPVVTVENASGNDTTPEITGTVDDKNATVHVVIKDGEGQTVQEGDATVSDNGTWSYTPETALPDGDYTVEVTAKDEAGNTSTETGAVTVDTTAPVVTVENASGNDTTPEITGTVDDKNATVHVVIKDGEGNTVQEGDATVSDNGTWSYTPETALPDGNYSVEVVATDKQGNEGKTNGSATVDTTAPSVTVSDSTGNDTTPEITGTVDDNEATVHVVIKDGEGNTVQEGDATVSDNGTWSYTPETALPDGNYTVEVVATDKQGNEGKTNGSATVDTTAPVVTVENASGNDTTPEITGTVDDKNATVHVVIKDGEGNTVQEGDATVDNGNWSYTPETALPDGDYTVEVVATDKQGNEGKTNGSATVDTTAPVVTVENASGNDTTPEITGTVDDNDATVHVTIKDNEGNTVAEGDATVSDNGTWSYTPETALPDGDYYVEVTATDNVGNKGEATGKAHIDATAPEAPTVSIPEATDGYINAAELNDENGIQTIVTLPEGTVAGDTVTVTFKPSNGGEAITVEHKVTEEEVTNKSVTLDIKDKTFADGEYTATAVVTDQAGNKGKESDPVPFTVDTVAPGDTDPDTEGVEQAPTVSIPEATDGYINAAELNDENGIQTIVTLPEGTVAGDTVTVTFKPSNGGEAITVEHKVTEEEVTNKSVTLDIKDKTFADGEYTATAVVTDQAGNEGKESTPVSFTVDTTAPVAPEVTIEEAKDGFVNSTELSNGIEVKVALTADAKAGDQVLVYLKDGSETLKSIKGKVSDSDVKNGYITVVIPKDGVNDGNYQVTAIITDKAENTGAESTADASHGTIFTVDTKVTAPSIELIGDSNSDGIFNRNELTTGHIIKAKVTPPAEAENGDTIVVSDGKTTFTLTVSDVDSDSTITASGKELSFPVSADSTVINVTASLTDKAGNTASAEDSSPIDQKPPVVTINPLLTDDTTPTITGTVDDLEASLSISIVDSDGNLLVDAQPITSVNKDGSWSYTVTSPVLANGTYNILVNATDKAGNKSNKVGVGSLEINTGLHVVATDDLINTTFIPTSLVSTNALAHYDDQKTLGLLDGDSEIAKINVTNPKDQTVWLTVKQDNLVSLTDAFEVVATNVESGQEYQVSSASEKGGLLAGALGLDTLGTLGDGKGFAFSIKDLPAGDYSFSVKGDSSKLSEVLKTIDLSTLGSNTIKDLVNDTVLSLLHDALVGNSEITQGLLQQISLNNLLKVAEDTPGLGTLLGGVDLLLKGLLDNPLAKPLLGDLYNTPVSDIIAGKAGGALGFLLTPLGTALDALINEAILNNLDTIGEALYNHVLEPLVKDILLEGVLDGSGLSTALDTVLGGVKGALDTLGLGEILPAVDKVIDLVADKVLSNPLSLFPGLVADVYVLDGLGAYHAEGNVTETHTNGTNVDVLDNGLVTSISHKDTTISVDSNHLNDNEEVTISGDFGQLIIDENGQFSYDVTDPSKITEEVKEEFTYTIRGENGNEDSATLTINIKPGAEAVVVTEDIGPFLQGGTGNDILTGNDQSNTAVFYNLINTDATGGNGTDTWTNFTLGNTVEKGSVADKINISDLLINFDPETSNLSDYLKVTSDGTDTTIAIDRDGTASTYQSTDLLVLKGVETTLETLVNNQQIIL